MQTNAQGVPVVAYVASKELAQVSSLLPSNKMRSMMVHSLIKIMGLLSPNYSEHGRIQVISPSRASSAALSAYHSRDYLDYVLDPQHAIGSSNKDHNNISLEEFGLEDDCPHFKGLHEYVPLVGGASLTAARALTLGIADIAICWDGGRHHAQKSRASGFCYVADCILILLSLKRASITLPHQLSVARKARIMYLDLDLHFSDAVSQAFHSPSSTSISQILTLSIHHSSPGFFPVSNLSNIPTLGDPSFDPFTLGIPLQRGASDSTYKRIWRIVEAVRASFDPDFVVVQCGVDALAGDPCQTFNWSLGSAEGSLGWCVERIKDWPGKKLFLGGGGYNSPNAARSWTYLTSILLGSTLPLDSQIPDHPGFPLYSPSFTLDIPAGNMRDENTDEYLSSVERCFEDAIAALQERLQNC